MAQATYPPPVATSRDDLAATAKSTSRELHLAPSLLVFLASKQRKTLGTLPEAAWHPEASLLNSYIEEGIPVHTVPPWSIRALETAIVKVPHSSACTPEMAAFIWGEMQQRIQDGFSILFPAADAVHMFGSNIKLSCIAAVPRAHCQPCLILKLLEKSDEGTPSVNDTNDREFSPGSMQFGRAFPYVLQKIWEADPVQGPVQVSKLDFADAYHCVTLCPYQVGAFAYVVPSASVEEGCIICIDLVLPMVWVDLPNFFCAFLETLTDVTNALVDTDFPVPSYGTISKIPAT